MNRIFTLSDRRPPQILLLYNQEDRYFHDLLLTRLLFLQTGGIVNIRSWFLSDNLINRELVIRQTEDIIRASNVIVVLASSRLMQSTFFNEYARRWVFDDDRNKSIVPLMLTPMENSIGRFDDLFAPTENILPLDRQPLFYQRSEIEYDQVIAEIVEKVVQELERKYFQPTTYKVEERSKIFISYSRKNFEIAEQIHLYLSSKGIKTWIDKYNLKIGQNWVNGIDDALRNSWSVILVMSEGAKESEYVTYEWSFAMGASCCIVPIMIEPVFLHPKLQPINHLVWYPLEEPLPGDKLMEALEYAHDSFSSGSCNK